MQKTFLICETVNHFHTITLDEELDIDDIIERAKPSSKMYETGYEAVESILKAYKDRYGFDYKIKPNDCGTEVLDMDVIEEM